MLSPTIWLQLKRETREAIAKEFGLSKSGHTEVVNNELVCDGYTVFDLQGITLEKLKAFTLNNSDDFYFQFTKVVNWFDGDKGVVIENTEINIPVEEKPLEINKKKRNGKTKSK